MVCRVQTPGDSKERGTARDGVNWPREGEVPDSRIVSPYWVGAVTQKRRVCVCGSGLVACEVRDSRDRAERAVADGAIWVESLRTGFFVGQA